VLYPKHVRVVVLQSNYIPWKGYFDLIHDADLFVYYDEVQYTKNDWRNRNRIYPKNGLQWLSIPIAKRAVKQRISEVELPATDWRTAHYKSLYYGYASAPCFGQLEPLLVDVYQQREWKHLVELNRHLIETISRMLGIETRFEDSRNFSLEGDRVTRLIALLKHVGATEYISGPAGRDYLSGSEGLFADNDIRTIYKDYGGYPTYAQLADPFEHGVSILDLLANLPLEEIPYYVWGWRGSSAGQGV